MDAAASTTSDASPRTDGSNNINTHGATPSAPPVTNAILSTAVVNAISQMDTKLAFDMMLLSEQLSTLDSDNKCLKDENAFLKTQLATQTQAQSEMYHYLSTKLDQHVVSITALERTVADSQLVLEQRELEHAAHLVAAHNTAQFDAAAAATSIAALTFELQQLEAFAQQKSALEAHVEALEATLAAQTVAFTDEKRALERHAIVEHDRVKHDMLERLRDAKDALLQHTDAHMATATKRTMMENDHFKHELAFQSSEAEKLLVKSIALEVENKRLRVQIATLEATSDAMAKKNVYYHRIVQQLERQEDHTALNAALQSPPSSVHKQCSVHKKCRSADTTDSDRVDGTKSVTEVEAVTAPLPLQQQRVIELEAALTTAHAWIDAFQTEKQFIVAQQDEIIQFLCRAVQDATLMRHEEHEKQASDDDSGDQTGVGNVYQPPGRAVNVPTDAQLARFATQITTMDDMVTTILPPPRQAHRRTSSSSSMVTTPLDELSSNETRAVVQFLLEKMLLYQQRLALLFQSNSSSNSSTKETGSKSPVANGPTSKHREQIAKQLGVALPPIHNATLSSSVPAASSLLGGGKSPMSPLKQHRRTVAHTSMAASSVGAVLSTIDSGNDSAMPNQSSSTDALLLQSPPAHRRHVQSQMLLASPSNGLVAMATNPFNFYSTTTATTQASKSPLKSPVKCRTGMSSSGIGSGATGPHGSVKPPPSYYHHHAASRKNQAPQSPSHDPALALVFTKTIPDAGTTATTDAASPLAHSREMLSAWSSASIPPLASDVRSSDK